MKLKFALILFFVCLGLFSCELLKMDPEPDRSELPDWTSATHGNNVEPNYEVVFPQDRINTLEITLSKASYDSLVNQANMLFPKTPIEGGGFTPEGGAGQIAGAVPPAGNAGNPDNVANPIPPGGIPGEVVSDQIKFIWAESSVKLNGKEWYHVGFRLKGRGSLADAIQNESIKFPFKLKFDKFEDKFPAINNQRFYGFKELSFASGSGDSTYIKDKLAGDLFREAGVPTARTSFCKVYINTGDGLKYYGIYTLTETIEDTMVKNQFAGSNGNVYKPLSTLSSFNPDELRLRNNEQNPNYSDIKAFIDALNDPNRTKNREAWRAKLEKIFEVDKFLKYLAVNNTIVNWDTYSNNYYVYFSNRTGKFTFIPWDFNLSFDKSIARMGIDENGNNIALEPGDLQLIDYKDHQVLLNYMADDPIYQQKYKEHVLSFNQNLFMASRMNGIIDKHVNLISGAVSQEVWPYTSFKTNNFMGAISKLKMYIATRNQEVNKFLNKK